jgi:hypothetical protein
VKLIVLFDCQTNFSSASPTSSQSSSTSELAKLIVLFGCQTNFSYMKIKF